VCCRRADQGRDGVARAIEAISAEGRYRVRLKEHLSEVLREIGELMIRLARVESHGPGRTTGVYWLC
jgi:hypothetical protein